MKLAPILLLALMPLAALAQSFHSGIPLSHKRLIKKDLRYLFSSPQRPDPALKEISGLLQINGQQLHNFLVNRVRFLVGQDYSIQSDNLFQQEGHLFPTTPIPNVSASTNGVAAEQPTTTLTSMSNLGSGLYLGGKTHQLLLGIQFDRTRILATSPRVGILQMGEGLFHPGMLINPELSSEANSISRLSTLFHEARHSDGTGLSTGFLHTVCPVGHAFAGRSACDNAANGAYALGAMLERHLMLNCRSCTETEKTMLAANVSDSFSRIIRPTTTEEITQLRKLLDTYINTRNLYREMSVQATADRRESMLAEVLRLDEKITQTEARLVQAVARLEAAGSILWDATPEGQFTSISLSTSVRQMQQQLREQP